MEQFCKNKCHVRSGRKACVQRWGYCKVKQKGLRVQAVGDSQAFMEGSRDRRCRQVKDRRSINSDIWRSCFRYNNILNAQTFAEGTPLCAECTEYEHAHVSLCEHLYKSWMCPAALWSHVHDLVRVISPLLQKIKQQQILIAGLCLINIDVLILIYLTGV